MTRVYVIIAGVVVGFIFAILWRRNPIRQIENEFAAIEAAKVAKQTTLEKGKIIARRRIENYYARSIKKFNKKQTRKVESLRGDPAALARWLTRVSG